MSRKCAQCGVESEIEEAFLPKRESYYSDRVFYCPACQQKIETETWQGYLIGLVIVIIGGFVWVMARPENDFPWLVLQFALFGCFIIITTVLHELGHVLAALIARGKVFRVTVGLGKTLYKRDFCGIEWKFCAIPVSGSTLVGIGDRTLYRTRSFFISAGGPLTNLLLACAALAALNQISSHRLVFAVEPFMLANAFALVLGLVPTKVNISGTRTASDGLRLLRLPFMSRSEIEREIESHYAWQGYEYSMKGRIEDAMRIYEKGLARFPDSVALKSEVGRLLLHTGDYVDARNLFLQLQKKTDVNSVTAVHLLNAIATADVMIGTKELLDEADAFSKTACEKMPWQTEFKGTRGLVLLKKGNTEQGLALLKEAMEKTEDSSQKAVYAFYIAGVENKG